jgi:Mrp family chromosome partitioning ATPase
MGKMTDALRKARLLKGQKKTHGGSAPAEAEHPVPPGAKPEEPQAPSRAVEVGFLPSPTSSVASDNRPPASPQVIEEEPESVPSTAPASPVLVEAPPRRPAAKTSTVLPEVEPGPEPVAVVKTPTRASVLPEVEPTPVETGSPYLRVHYHKEDRTADEFRMLRNALAADGSAARVILVVSSGPGEGKTTLAMNLAASFANTFGERVLLVDGNFLRPKIGDVLALPPEGLAQAIRGRMSPEEAVVRTDVPGLWAVSAGGSEGRSEGLLDSQSLAEVLQQLRSRFTRVIMELPSAGDAPEGLAFIAQADAVLIPVMKSRTRRKALRRLLQTIKERGGRKISCVFVKV